MKVGKVRIFKRAMQTMLPIAKKRLLVCMMYQTYNSFTPKEKHPTTSIAGAAIIRVRCVRNLRMRKNSISIMEAACFNLRSKEKV